MESLATGFSSLAGSKEGQSSVATSRPVIGSNAGDLSSDQKHNSGLYSTSTADSEELWKRQQQQQKPGENPFETAATVLLNINNENQQKSPGWRTSSSTVVKEEVCVDINSDVIVARQGVVRLAPSASQAMKLEAADTSIVLPAQHVEVIKTTPKHLHQLSPIKDSYLNGIINNLQQEEHQMTLNFNLDQSASILADLRNMPPSIHSYDQHYGNSSTSANVYSQRIPMYADPINSYQLGIGGHPNQTLISPNMNPSNYGLLPPPQNVSDPYSSYRHDAYYPGVRAVYPDQEELLQRLNQQSLYPKPVSVEMPSPVDSGLGQELIVTPSKHQGDPGQESYVYTDMSPSVMIGGNNSRCTSRQTDRMAASSRDSPVHIPKLTLERGFQYTLEAPVSTSVRKEDDKMTYINKGQFYTVVLDYIPDPNKPLKSSTVKTQLMLVFRDDKPYEEEMKCWTFWHQRQHSAKQRILDVDTKNCSGMNGSVEEISHNGVQFYWNPTETQAKINVAVQCLSTDFSNQKGVKGFPLHLQVDTYDEAIDSSRPFHRGYCQIKVFCDKGANRKMLHEQRRDEKRRIQGRKKSDGEYHEPCERSDFYHMSNLDKKAVLFTPPENGYDERDQQSVGSCLQYPGGTVMEPWSLPTIPNDALVPSATQDMNSGISEPLPKRPKVMPIGRVMLYVRKPEEQVFTPLHLIPPGVDGLVDGLCEKYGIDNITGLYRQCRKGVTVKIDDDMLRHYCNEDTFLLQLIPDNGGVQVTLTELDVQSPMS